MDFIGKIKDINRNWITGKFLVTFETDIDVTMQFKDIQDKELSVVAKKYRKKRSLDANAYAWVLMQKIAEQIHSDKWSVYLDMLGNYGVFTHIIVRPSVADRVKDEWRTVKDLGDVMVGGQTGTQLQYYLGSSTYNTKEMSVFIDGIVRECRDLDIDVTTPNEIERMKQEWGVSV